ncbi:MAG TPA: hypothetical protein VMY34_07205 [Acidimicrobiales bacterium]|nr:hypothetical protein [Acidimicrobiales bacterium]
MRRVVPITVVVVVAALAGCSRDTTITRSTLTTAPGQAAPRRAADDLTCPPGTKVSEATFDLSSGGPGSATPEEAVRPYAAATWPERVLAQVERTDTFAVFGTAEGDVVVHLQGGDGRWVLTETAACVPDEG